MGREGGARLHRVSELEDDSSPRKTGEKAQSIEIPQSRLTNRENFGIRGAGMKHCGFASVLFAVLVVAIFAQPKPAHAQHGNYVLGTIGIMGAQQPPEGLLYQNLWSYYPVSDNGFVNTGVCNRTDNVCLNANVNASGTMDLFIDQNIFWLVTPFKLPVIGGSYGLSIDVPFAYAATTGAASLQPTIVGRLLGRNLTLTGPTPTSDGGVTKGTISDIYFEPIDLGWHLKHLDAIVSGGFMAPTGPYNPKATVNIGYGHWCGILGLGGILYPDDARTWSATLFAHYEIYGAQEGHPYTLGNQLPLEWALAKSFNFENKTFQQFSIGTVGYAQWQTTDNNISVSSTDPQANEVLHELKELHPRVYAAGPGVQLLTSFGLFDLRYYEEFGAYNTPSARELVFSLTLAGKPWS